MAVIAVFLFCVAVNAGLQRGRSLSATITGPLTSGMCSFGEYPLPSDYTTPAAIYSQLMTDTNGNLWFTEYFLGKMTKMDTSGNMTEFQFTDAPNYATGDASGNMWFSSPDGHITKRSPDGTTQTFTPPTRSDITGIAFGPDGNVWFTENNASQIGKLNPSTGVMQEFPVLYGSQPSKITPGPDGNLWFMEPAANCGTGHPPHIGKITPAGVVTEYATQTCKLPIDVAAGPDGKIWVTQSGGVGQDLVSSLSTTDGAFHDYSVTSGNGAGYLTAGPDGNVWFTQKNGGLAKMTPAGVIKEFPGLLPSTSLGHLSVGPDGNLWVMELDRNKVAKVNPAALDQNSCTTGSSAATSSSTATSSSAGTPKFTLYTSPTKLTWQQAETSCESKGAHLATINSDADSTAAYAALGGKQDVWIGLNDIQNEGDYRWVCGNTPATYYDWDIGQPNGAGIPNNDCVFMNHSQSIDGPSPKWHDVGCDGESFQTTSYLCETGTTCAAVSSSSTRSSQSARSSLPYNPSCALTKAEQASILVLDVEPLPLTGTPPEVKDLQNAGYSVTYHTRITLPTIQYSFLRQFQAVWVFNGCGSQLSQMSSAEVQAFHDYYMGGGNLLVSIGNLKGKKTSTSFDCASRVSQISEPLGVAFNGLTTQSNTCVAVNTSTDPLLAGVQNVFREAYSTMSLLPTVSWGSDKPAFIGSTAKGDPVFAVIKKKSPHGAAFFFPQQGGLQTSCTTAQGYADIFGSLGYKPGCNACTP